MSVRLLALLALSGCASSGLYNMSDSWCSEHKQASAYRCPGHNPAESYDQANLKKNDVADCLKGNPVFIAPNGNLEQCP